MEDLPSYVTPMRNTGCSPPDDCSLLESNSYAPSYTPVGLAFSQSLAIWFSGAMVVTKNLGIGIDAAVVLLVAILPSTKGADV